MAFQAIFRYKLPEKYEVMNILGVPLLRIVLNWFSTLFSQNLKLDTLLKTWDFLFLKGEIVLYRVALRILHTQYIFNKGTEQVESILQKPVGIDWDIHKMLGRNGLTSEEYHEFLAMYN